MPSEELPNKKKNKYQIYVEALCHRYANRLVSAHVEQQAQDIKPLMEQLVSCVCNLITYLSYQETVEIYNNLLTLNQEDFYKWSYSQYQKRADKRLSNIPARESLLYALLWRDFHTGNFKKIKEGGRAAPILLEIINRYLDDEPYELLCDSISFPVDEVPYFSGSGVKCFMANCREAVVPPSFNEEIFTSMIHEEIEEIIDTMYNFYGKVKNKENAHQEHTDCKGKTPVSWVQKYLAPSQGFNRKKVAEKKVRFDEESLIPGPSMQLDIKK